VCVCVCVWTPSEISHTPPPPYNSPFSPPNRILNAYFMAPPFCTNLHKNAPTQRSIIINHFITHDSEADAAPTSHVRACKSGCYYRLLTIKKNYTRVWGGPNGITFTPKSQKSASWTTSRKGSIHVDQYIYIYLFIYLFDIQRTVHRDIFL